MIRYPPRVSSGRIRTNVSTASLFATIVDLVGSPLVVPSGVSGSSLFAEEHSGPAVYAELGNAVDMLRDVVSDEGQAFDFMPFDFHARCIIDGQYKYIWSSNEEHQLYDIGADFGESYNLLHGDPERADGLYLKLEEWHASVSKPSISLDTPELDKETGDALRALGYRR